MKHTFKTVLCVVAAFSMMSSAGISLANSDTVEPVAADSVENSTVTSDTFEMIGMPNPFEDCDTIEAAEKLAGFESVLPTAISGYAAPVIQAVSNDMIQVIFSNGDDDEIFIRQAYGESDISGDYNVYDESGSITVNDVSISTHGSRESINVATWTSGDFTFAIDSSAGLDENTLIDIINQMQPESASEEIPNPWTDCDNMSTAAALAGFDMSVPDSVARFDGMIISVLPDSLIEVTYGADAGLCLRKANYSGDISGDHNEYESTSELDVNGVSVTLRMNGDSVYSAIWECDGYSYSISCDSGIDEGTVQTIVESIK